MTFWKSKKFKKEQSKWYKKLKRAGFNDIEDDQGRFTNHQDVIQFSLRNGFKTAIYESIRDYYSWAQEMTTKGEFESAKDRKIWVMHSLGRGQREIATQTKLHQCTVSRRIKKIRAYLQSQKTEEEVSIEDDFIQKAA